MTSQVCDPDDGQPWIFDVEAKRQKARELVMKQKPWLPIGSPMCKAFSALMNLNRERMGEDTYRKLVEHGMRHLLFCIELYNIQVSNGRLFLHEHPETAWSWKVSEVVALSQQEGVHKTTAHMCQYGMTSRDEQGTGLVKKPTTFLTNSQHIAEQLSLKCQGGHRHVQLVNGRAHKAEIYPRPLCYAMLKGLFNELVDRGVLHPQRVLQQVCEEAIDEVQNDLVEFVDDLSGAVLDPELVLKARQEEVETYQAKGGREAQ